MSILIKGMEMPSECEYCALCRFYRDTKLVCCNAANKILKPHWERPDWTHLDVKRPDWCPLVEVPTSHGRLVDADNLVSVIDDEFTEQTRTFYNPIEVLNKAVLCGFAKDVITAAPTIIEGEKGIDE